MNKKLLTGCLIFGVLLFVGILAAGTVAFILNSPVSRSGDTVLFSVSRGSSVHSVAASLADSSLVRSGQFAYLYARVCNHSLKAGTYRLSPDMTTSEIIQYIADGKQEYIRVTVPEGLTLTKTARHLEAAGVVSSADFIAAAAKPELLARFHIPGKTAEGFLFPDTYFFPYGIDADDVVVKMLENFFTKIRELKNVPEKPEELFSKVILASIIEREYRVPAEAPSISSVFTNRLKIGMGLQSCATIEYIITEIRKEPHPTRLTIDDLEISSDYNTYRWAGLPPGPISSPGLVSLGAAFNPADTGYLYFRLTDPEAGSHSFTRSLEEHVRAGRLLVLKKAAGS